MSRTPTLIDDRVSRLGRNWLLVDLCKIRFEPMFMGDGWRFDGRDADSLVLTRASAEETFDRSLLVEGRSFGFANHGTILIAL